MKKNNEKGQALVELIIFLPLMFMFYSMIAGFAYAIYGSINQQKIARGYFYYKLQNNSYIPKPEDDKIHRNWGMFGMYFIGWRDYFDNERPVAPCYELTIPLKPGETDKCEEKYTRASSLFIRVMTVYGTCGSTYQRVGNNVLPVPDFIGGSFSDLIGKQNCLITP
jgi:hypothetical protein